jgi:pilus assembly protein FimV
MIINCRNCNTSFNLSDELLKDTGSKVKCSKCNYIFKVFPPHIQNEPDFNQIDRHPEFEEKINTKSYLSSDQQLKEEDKLFSKSDFDKDWDLSEIEKILQEENDKIFDDDSMESSANQGFNDEMELDNLDDIGDLFKEEGASDDPAKENEATASDHMPDLQIIPGKSKIKDLDLSELDDFFKEDDDWEDLSEVDTESKISGLEFDVEKEEALDFSEPEDVEEIEDIDLSDLDDLFKEDEVPSMQTSASLQAPPADDDETASLITFPDNNPKAEPVSDKIADDMEFDLDLNLEMEKDFLDDQQDLKSSENFEIDLDFENSEPASDKIADDMEFDLDLNLEMEKDSLDDQQDLKSSENFEIDLDFAEKDQDLLPEFEDADIISDISHKEKESNIDTEKPLNEELNFDHKEYEKKNQLTDFDEEFDLSDLEKIIDLEEESRVETESLKSKNENEEQEHEFQFDLAIEPDGDEETSQKVVAGEEELNFDASKLAMEDESDYSDKIEEAKFEFNVAENNDETVLIEKDDYNLEETDGKFHKVFDTVTLIDTAHKHEIDDDLEIEEERTKEKSRFGKLVLVAVAFILLAAAGYGIFTALNISGFHIPFIGSYMNTQTPDPGNLKIIAYDLNSKFSENKHVGKVFIITGTVKNEYSEPRSFIKITGRLYEPAQKLSHTEHVYAGNAFSELELNNLDMEAIKNRLNNRFGQNRSNVNIEPGKSVPFVIIFSQLPQQLEEFTVEIESSSPA